MLTKQIKFKVKLMPIPLLVRAGGARTRSCTVCILTGRGTRRRTCRTCCWRCPPSDRPTPWSRPSGRESLGRVGSRSTSSLSRCWREKVNKEEGEVKSQTHSQLHSLSKSGMEPGKFGLRTHTHSARIFSDENDYETCVQRIVTTTIIAAKIQHSHDLN